MLHVKRLASLLEWLPSSSHFQVTSVCSGGSWCGVCLCSFSFPSVLLFGGRGGLPSTLFTLKVEPKLLGNESTHRVPPGFYMPLKIGTNTGRENVGGLAGLGAAVHAAEPGGVRGVPRLAVCI